MRRTVFAELVSLVSQMGTNKCASQAGMTAYGTRRHLYDPKTHTDKPYDQTTISLQMGTNKGASQVKPSLLSTMCRAVTEVLAHSLIIIMVFCFAYCPHLVCLDKDNLKISFLKGKALISLATPGQS